MPTPMTDGAHLLTTTILSSKQIKILDKQLYATTLNQILFAPVRTAMLVLPITVRCLPNKQSDEVVVSVPIVFISGAGFLYNANIIYSRGSLAITGQISYLQTQPLCPDCIVSFQAAQLSGHCRVHCSDD